MFRKFSIKYPMCIDYFRKFFRMHFQNVLISGTRTLCFLNYKFPTKKSSCITELSLTTEKKLRFLICR
jgi:hypothetical protein